MYDIESAKICILNLTFYLYSPQNIFSNRPVFCFLSLQRLKLCENMKQLKIKLKVKKKIHKILTTRTGQNVRFCFKTIPRRSKNEKNKLYHGMR